MHELYNIYREMLCCSDLQYVSAQICCLQNVVKTDQSYPGKGIDWCVDAEMVIKEMGKITCCSFVVCCVLQAHCLTVWYCMNEVNVTSLANTCFTQFKDVKDRQHNKTLTQMFTLLYLLYHFVVLKQAWKETSEFQHKMCHSIVSITSVRSSDLLYFTFLQ